MFYQSLCVILFASSAFGSIDGPATGPASHVPGVINATEPTMDFGQAGERGVSPDKVHPSLIRLLDESDEPIRTWVFFTDKGLHTQAELDQAIAETAASYNQRATQRRALRRVNQQNNPLLFDEHDLPVVTSYADGVIATGATLRTTRRWLNAVSVMASSGQVAQISKLPFVKSLQPVR